MRVSVEYDFDSDVMNQVYAGQNYAMRIIYNKLKVFFAVQKQSNCAYKNNLPF